MNTIYENVILEEAAKDLLLTAVNTRALLTVDTDMAEGAGMTKTINTYTYAGEVEELEEREGNEECGGLTYIPHNYTVKVLQQKCDYTDEDAMKNANVVDFLMKGATQTMANKLTTDFFDCLDAGVADETIGTTEASAIGYDAIVDAVADMNVEDESQLFLLISPAMKAEIRKDADYKTAQFGEVVYNGQIGTLCGIPVVVSKAVNDTAFLLTKEALTLFIKKEVEVEQVRNPNIRTNDIYMRTAYVVAVTDATKVRAIVKA